MCGVEYICDDTMRMVVSVWCLLHLRQYHEDGGDGYDGDDDLIWTKL